MSDNIKQMGLQVEVVLAMPDLQELISIQVDEGTSLGKAIEQSGILDRFKNFELDPARVGIFGNKAAIDQVLRDGDRVEIYRPLIADPKESRRQRALKQAST